LFHLHYDGFINKGFTLPSLWGGRFSFVRDYLIGKDRWMPTIFKKPKASSVSASM
jgi:hypothetical protein